MAQIAFTDREMRRAWRENLIASAAFIQVKRNNAHRLLLFYAIECGLKAILMKKKSINCTEDCEEIGKAQHDINKLLDGLGAGNKLKLPNQLNMSLIKDKNSKKERKLESGKINQMWRYGGLVTSTTLNGKSVKLTDDDLEKYLIWEEIVYINNSDPDEEISSSENLHLPEPFTTPPSLVTFYSFKGGVGRTTHLAAYIFALFDPRVQRFFVTTATEQSVAGLSLVLEQVSRVAPSEEDVDNSKYFDPSVIISFLTKELEELVTELKKLWGEKLGGANEARTAGWIFAALTDFKGRLQARDIVRLLFNAADITIERSEEMQFDKWMLDRLLPPKAIRGALDPCSARKVIEAAEEYPEFNIWVRKVENEYTEQQKRIPFTAEDLSLDRATITMLEDMGVIYEDRSKDNSTSYYMPEIFRTGLKFTSVKGARPRVLVLKRKALGIEVL